MPIVLPHYFERKLRGRSELLAMVNGVLDWTTRFVDDPTRGLPFFPEYTDHGITHIQDVLNSAAGLISDSARSLITPEDVAVLAMATLTHDIAMHITEDQFLSLLGESESASKVGMLDFKSWATLWQDYFFEAKRWDDPSILNVLGHDDNGTGELAAEIIPIDQAGAPENWSRCYRRFIGEFVRRHHARMAHEFLRFGIPTASDGRFPFVHGIAELIELAGFIARSHHLSLRDTYAHLEDVYTSKVRCANTHPVFLMVILRIADYVQLESSRAPSASSLVRRIRNPYSARQWNIHQSISEVREDDSDPHCLFVRAAPPNTLAFLDLQQLLASIQSELDSSWAALGEIFSRHSKLKKLGIKVRRIRSNIDNVSTFRAQVQYIPGRFSFTTDRRLLDKLVSPLYGDRPTVAIREMLQNSIDAVREYDRRRIDKDRDCEQIPRIWLRLWQEDGVAWFEIEDHGVGMTQETLQSYFLRAGASFRDSSQWHADFVNDGRATVTRSGRFGVGALAAFLLGSHIEVTTRHHKESPDAALTFQATVTSDPIEVKKVRRQPPGTTIKVRLTQNTYENLRALDGLEWDWFRWKLPVVVREIDGNNNLPKLTQIPMLHEQIPAEWHRINVTNYQEVAWTYGRAPRLVLNGITVGTSASSYGYSRQFHWEGDANTFRIDWPFKVPFVSVCDNDAKFPVDLQRFSAIGHRFPFATELIEDITRDFAAFCLVFAPTSPPLSIKESLAIPRYPGTEDAFTADLRPGNWVFSQKGAFYNNRANLNASKTEIATIVLRIEPPVARPRINRLREIPASDESLAFYGYLFRHQHFGERSFPMALAQLMCLPVEGIGPCPNFYDSCGGAALIMSSELSIRNLDYTSSQFDLSKVEVRELSIGEDVKVHIWRIGNFELEQLPDDDLIREIATSDAIFGQLWRPLRSDYHSPDAFEVQWKELFPEVVIPYDMNERKSQFELTYQQLSKYIDKWEELRDAGQIELRRRFFRETRFIERL